MIDLIICWCFCRVIVAVNISTIQIRDLCFYSGKPDFKLVCIAYGRIIAAAVRAIKISPSFPASSRSSAAGMSTILIGIESCILIRNRKACATHVNGFMRRIRPCTIRILLYKSSWITTRTRACQTDADIRGGREFERPNKA